MGVLVLYPPEGDERRPEEVTFLESVASMLASIIQRKRADTERDEAQNQLLLSSRQAGMADVATGILHNVGNVLNSVNVSARLAANKVASIPSEDLARLAALVSGQNANEQYLLGSNEQRQRVSRYLARLADHLDAQRQSVGSELDALIGRIEHLKEIVAMQQSYATMSGVLQSVDLGKLIEDALRTHDAGFLRHNLKIVRDHEPLAPLMANKHKVLQMETKKGMNLSVRSPPSCALCSSQFSCFDD